MQSKQNNFDIYYEQKGEGEAVIFIPGGFFDHHCWKDVIPSISEEYQTITLDNRASGLSVDTDDEYTVALLANDVLRLMDHLKLEKAHIVGHSMGGFTAQYFAAMYSERVISLSLLSSILAMNTQGEEFLDQLFADAVANPEALQEKIFAMGGVHQSLPQILKQAKLCRHYDARPFIPQITAPTIIMSGLHEPIMSVAESRRLASQIKNVKKVLTFDCNHQLPIEVPALVANSLLEHFQDNRLCQVATPRY